MLLDVLARVSPQISALPSTRAPRYLPAAGALSTCGSHTAARMHCRGFPLLRRQAGHETDTPTPLPVRNAVNRRYFFKGKQTEAAGVASSLRQPGSPREAPRAQTAEPPTSPIASQSFETAPRCVGNEDVAKERRADFRGPSPMAGSRAGQAGEFPARSTTREAISAPANDPARDVEHRVRGLSLPGA